MEVRRVRTPTLLQMEAIECGAASLGIVLGHHGRHVALEELRERCGVSRDGTSARAILRAAASYGLEGAGWSRGAEELREVPVPAVLHWNFDHFLVLEGVDGDVVYLNDPATGPRRVAWDELEAAFTGVVLTFAPTAEFRTGGEPGGLEQGLREWVIGSGSGLLYLILVGLLLVAPGLVLPVLAKVFIDRYLVHGVVDWLQGILLIGGLTLLLQAALLALQQYHLARLEIRLRLAGSSRFLAHVLQLPIAFFSHRTAADLSSRLAFHDHLASFLTRNVTSATIAAFTALLYGVVLLVLSPPLTGIVVTAVALLTLVNRAALRGQRDLSLRLQTEVGAMAGASAGGLASIETIKATAGESDLFARWSGFLAKVTGTEQALGAERQMVQALPAFLTSTTAALVLGVGGWLVMRGTLTMGTLVAFQALTISFMSPVAHFAGVGLMLQDMLGGMTRMDDIYRTPVAVGPGADAAAEARADAPPKLDGRVELDAVVFGYAPLADPLIRDLGLRLEPGGRLALVGGSGSGKSTVAKLVTGLREPWTGEVRLDGAPRATLPRERLAASLAMVDQSIMLFEGTIRDNLTLWDDAAPDDKLIRACKDALIHELVLSRPGGYDGEVAEGGRNFSGGERQRLEIARALVTDPRVLVLDEATSALDPVTEEAIYRNLRRRGCTLIIISHRLSTIRDADEILVLHEGRVLQRGTHEELMLHEDGRYAQMVLA